MYIYNVYVCVVVVVVVIVVVVVKRNVEEEVRIEGSRRRNGSRRRKRKRGLNEEEDAFLILGTCLSFLLVSLSDQSPNSSVVIHKSFDDAASWAPGIVVIRPPLAPTVPQVAPSLPRSLPPGSDRTALVTVGSESIPLRPRERPFSKRSSHSSKNTGQEFFRFRPLSACLPPAGAVARPGYKGGSGAGRATATITHLPISLIFVSNRENLFPVSAKRV